MVRNVLTRRREYGTYLATARRHRRRLKMQKRGEQRSFQPALRPSSAVEEDYVIHLSSASLFSCDVYGQQPGRCRTLSSLLIHFLSFYTVNYILAKLTCFLSSKFSHNIFIWFLILIHFIQVQPELLVLAFLQFMQWMLQQKIYPRLTLVSIALTSHHIRVIKKCMKNSLKQLKRLVGLLLNRYTLFYSHETTLISKLV